jgi:hypothetical protein
VDAPSVLVFFAPPTSRGGEGEGEGDSSAPRTSLARGRKRPCPTLPVSDQAPLCGSGIAQRPLSVSMPTSVQLMAPSCQQELIYRGHCIESGRVPQFFRSQPFTCLVFPSTATSFFPFSSLPFSPFLPTSLILPWYQLFGPLGAPIQPLENLPYSALGDGLNCSLLHFFIKNRLAEFFLP